MKTMNLVRQNYEKPNFEILELMREYFEELIDASNEFEADELEKVFKQLVYFQDNDGSFNLVDSFEIESDCRVYYCYEPTYIGTALLMKAYLMDKDFFTGKEDIILRGAMHACCGRQLNGHGYDWLRDKIKAIDYFIKCDVKDFLKKYPNLCPEFTEMFASIKEDFALMVQEERFIGDWGESYEEDIRRIDEYLSKNIIFTYGTLMKGQSNHSRFLSDNQFVESGKIEGYEMYDLGWFPGIIAGDGTVYGEVYAVSDEDLVAINRLEGEGDLYIKTEVKVLLDSGKTIAASAYVYNHSVEDCKRLYSKYGSEDYVWYVSYGSNLLEERLQAYIQGGHCVYNGRNYSPCSDTRMPIEKRPVIIPYDMYYSNYDMGSWKNSAVCFLDLSHKGMSYGMAYKIKKSQLSEIHSKEGKSVNWYPERIRLADIDGVATYTFAGYEVKTKEPFNRVSAEYGIVLYKGMKECYPEMSDGEIFEYLEKR